MDHRLAKALSHPIRVRILDRLEGGPKSPKTVSGELDANLSVVSYHVGVLRDLGLIRLVEQIPRRGARENVYAIEPLGISAKALESPNGGSADPLTAVMRTMIEKCVAALRSGTAEAGDGSQVACISDVLDGRGWEEAVAILEETEKRLESVRAASAKRLAR